MRSDEPPAPTLRPAFAPALTRLRLELRGSVQGVGFRPFAYRLAHSLSLGGSVRNTGRGVALEIEGPSDRVERFWIELLTSPPAPAQISSVSASAQPVRGERDFRIDESRCEPAQVRVLPDQATCAQCLSELSDRNDRRYRYPFINCTQCGPRYTIVERLPYDRRNTTMAAFAMCSDCLGEYEDPASRRYHAQPNACPACGPSLSLTQPDGTPMARAGRAVAAAVELLREGRVVAVKGIGGYHLLVDATDDAAVARLRTRKARVHKAFAVMVQSAEHALELCELSESEIELLRSPSAPIVLAPRRREAHVGVAAAVAPLNPDLGVILPYSPLHHLLLGDFGGPLVATSGNRCDEPICTLEREAYTRLSGIADAFLVHDRPIARACEDSVVRVMAGRAVVLRRSRGYAPAPVASLQGRPMVAVGGHLKNTLAASVAGELVIAPHVGDLETPSARRQQAQVARDLLSLFDEPVGAVVADRHPDYGSRPVAEWLAERRGVPLREVQHHEAHLWACLADNRESPPCLGVVWDGMGLGDDGTLWGGEFLLATAAGVERFAHLRCFVLIGGDSAARDARRTALCALYELYGDAAFDRARACLEGTSPRELAILRRALKAGGRRRVTSSAGRLFDAVASLLGICQRNDYEGQAACELEFAARTAPEGATPYPIALVARNGAPIRVDWGPMLAELLGERSRGVPAAACAARFHAGLVEAIVAVARRAAVPKVALSGGCFQNPTLLQRSVSALRRAGFHPLWHASIPPNDGGLSAGQLAAESRHKVPACA